MIFYFSGTGNSAWVAQYVAKGLNDTLKFIPDEFSSGKHYVLRERERLGFIFPCYAWGVPTFVETFIRQIEVENVSYVYFVVTCGDDTGMTGSIFCKDVAKKGWYCMLGRAVVMPESYVCLPGFDTDPVDRERSKVAAAHVRVEQIVEDIVDGRGGFDTIPGRFAWIKSKIIRPLFNYCLITPRLFKSTDKCVGCGKCVTSCAFHNIKLDHSKHPVWNSRCVQCMHCYHACPTHAIEWGAFTKNKGQYLFK